MADIVDSGVYYTTISSTDDIDKYNYPSGTNGILLVYTAEDGNHVRQIWFRTGTVDSSDMNWFTRQIRTNTSPKTVGKWKRILGEDNKNDLFRIGTAIAANTDLNNITEAGNYYSVDTENTGTLKNKPSQVTTGFRLEVRNTTTNLNWYKQIIYPNANNQRVYIRQHGDEWSDWYYLTTNEDLDNHTHHASDITGLTASRALGVNSSGQISVASTTTTELNYVHGVTSNIQTQINNMKSSFQDGVDTLYNKCKSRGATPSTKTPTAIATAIDKIANNVTITSLGGNTSIDVKSKLPNDYSRLTKNNFIVELVKIVADGGARNVDDAIYPQFGTIDANATMSKSYNASTGRLTISGIECHAQSQTTGWVRYVNGYATVNVYAIY